MRLTFPQFKNYVKFGRERLGRPGASTYLRIINENFGRVITLYWHQGYGFVFEQHQIRRRHARRWDLRYSAHGEYALVEFERALGRRLSEEMGLEILLELDT